MGVCQQPDIPQALDQYLDQAAQLNLFSGFIKISRGNTVLLDKADGWKEATKKVPNASQTIYRIGSVTNTFIVIVILKLVENGQLRLTDKLNTYFPDFPQA
ncbi:MAG TPA: serine hydrolase domain-containing protein, partial [Flavitalea sp.]|nr:serine hydrolase domain-containing protein [Flavitalea sp.]